MGYIQINQRALDNHRIIMSVGGSISAYRTPDIVRDLKREGAEVQCILSDAASKIIGEEALEWASGMPVLRHLTGVMEHITFFEDQRKKNVFLMCPATYNQIGKIASGIADGMAETMFANALGTGTEIVVVPAMHYEMYNSAINMENIRKLRKLGVNVVEPRIEDGKAKIMWSDEIIDEILRRNVKNESILIISGKSELPIDPVRSLSNKSSGLTGISLVRAARRMGYEKITYLGNSEYRIPLYCSWIKAYNIDDFYQKTIDFLRENRVDYIIIPAALSDFRYEKSGEKIESKREIELLLKPREKLVEHINEITEKWEKKPRIIRFKLGRDDFEPQADYDYMTILNRVSDEPFGEGKREYTIFKGKEKIKKEKMDKIELAAFILEEMEK